MGVERCKKGVDPKRLTEKQKVFIEEWRKDGNATRAAMVAYDTDDRKMAAKFGHRALKHPLIRRAIGSLLEQDRKRREMEADEIIEHLTDCATRNVRDLFDENGILVLNHRVINGEVEGTTMVDLPDELLNAVDGIKQKTRCYESEDGLSVWEVETEVKLVSKAAALDMALRHKGLFAPTQSEVGVSVDWDTLHTKRNPKLIDVDSVEKRLLEEERGK